MPLKNTLNKLRLSPIVLMSLAIIANGCQKSNDSMGKSGNAPAAAPPSASAKNVILFIGDGMGISTITAGRIFDGQSQGKTGEEHSLSFEQFPNLALIKTYNYDAQVPDSAGTATAIMSGYKARIGTLNVPPDNLFAGCGDQAAPPTLSDMAKASGRSVGIISTARITHATPAAMFSHAASRDWEADKDISEEGRAAGCTSIAAQLTAPDAPVNIALGGGAKEFSAEQRASWAARGLDHIVIDTGADFKKLKPADHQDVFGLFSSSHMSFEADRDKTDEPSLAEMTAYAIDNLSARDDKGYVLMVEAGRIDHAHHGTNAYRALRDVQALNEAVKIALSKAGDDTLILVTADHSHVFTMSGYPGRGNPILGLVRKTDPKSDVLQADPVMAKDDKPYTTLGYHNGSHLRMSDGQPLSDNEVQAPDYRQEAAVPVQSETHGGEDVALFATGPGAGQVRGVMDQSEISGVIQTALGMK